ncbi:MAG: peptidoglycan DD-metalloendopeptidase family protein [Saprospiraceae bacterium]|nr:peptidoglycan DD-metalloendopeptidase family protein [Saprospiraceae bacterium]
MKQALPSNGWLVIGGVAFLTALILISSQIAKQRNQAASMALSPSGPPEIKRWGYSLNTYQLTENTLRSGDVLGEILMRQGLTYPQVAALVEASKGVFNINLMRAGKTLFFLKQAHEAHATQMVYEPSPYEYVVFNLTEPFQVNVVKRDVKTEIVAASGVLETSFWQALTDNGLNDELADGMIDVLSSSVDFYHQKQGDRFKVVYEQHFVEGVAVGTGKIIAAMYEREGKSFYAFNYEKEGEKVDYFDFDGRPAKKAFLKSPVKFSRISSRFNLHRLHPILGYHKAHLGTDYAAPYGTPIIAVAEGVVVEATRRGGNGNFVKIRHDGTYETQYLHMQGFARGIHRGTRVAQGQTIGYVGATGLATGPHCCFRFWKNGREVDHLRLNLPQPQPITGETLQQFMVVRDRLLQMLNGVEYRTFNKTNKEEEQASELELIPGVAP